MTTAPSHTTLVEQALELLWQGYDRYRQAFETITQRAGNRFEQRDWPGMRQDTVERLELYPQAVAQTQAELQSCLGGQFRNRRLWASLKSRFISEELRRQDTELASTFYNSVHRKMLQTVGIDPQLEFIAPQPQTVAAPENDALFFTLEADRLKGDTIQSILTRYGFVTPFVDLNEDAHLVSQRIGQSLERAPHRDGSVRIEMVSAPFFRDMSAYLIGQIHWADRHCPLVIALGHSDRGLYVDALLLKAEEVRILFSFTRAYFHVRTPSPCQLVSFLKEMMPQKRTAELYIVLGFHKHGKTELYRDLLHHQKVCGQDSFDFADGQRGMVMIVFNMPQDDLIYKLIRDRFASPKRTTRIQVMQKYDYVFKHDRAGRLVDVQTFENLEIEECCFTPELLAEIQSQAQRTATVENGYVVLHHVYVERRVTPLDLYVQQVDARTARAAVIDFGQAIKDLARLNVFPGDMLMKNFGVTQLGRVVFYDYDELCPLTDCAFRALPQARRYEDDLEAEPWFAVGENDVFPEEFAYFIGLAPDLRRIFLDHHADLMKPDFWQQTQDQISAGIWTPILPYTDSQRLRPAASAP